MDFSDAQVELGICFKDGRGTERNFDEAVLLFRRDIKNGNSDGIVPLRKCLQGSMGVEGLGGSGVILPARCRGGKYWRSLTIGNCTLGRCRYRSRYRSSYIALQMVQ